MSSTWRRRSTSASSRCARARPRHPGIPRIEDAQTMAYRNAIREGLRDSEFLYTLEHVPALLSDGVRALDELARNAELVGRDPRMRGVNIGDRVKSTACFSTVECGKIAAEASGLVPLLHLAGKDRLPHEAVRVIHSALD